MENLWHIPEDSDKPAVDFDKKLVTEEKWQKAFSEDLENAFGVVNEFNHKSLDTKEYNDRLLDLKLRFKSGERTQTLWNDLMNEL